MLYFHDGLAFLYNDSLKFEEIGCFPSFHYFCAQFNTLWIG